VPTRTDPIGIFDSGVGGLAVLAEIRRLMPGEDLIYYADSAHFPYGSRPPAEIITRAETVTRELLALGAKIIVVACNTATSAAIAHLRETFDVPFVGMEPALKPAAERTLAGKVALLVTPGTAHGEKLSALIDRYGAEVTVRVVPAPDLAERVEAGDLDGAATRALVRRYIAEATAGGEDVLALGCTHYAFLRRMIEDEAGEAVAVIEPSEAVARQVRRVLESQSMLNPRTGGGAVRYLTSGDDAAFAALRECLRAAGAEIPAERGRSARMHARSAGARDLDFREKLEAAWERSGSLLCIGLDPDPALMAIDDVAAFNIAIIEATSDLVCAYKPNVAFYEALGPERGYAALRKTLAAIPPHIITLADAKRGDVTNTASAYAKAIFDELGFDASTVNAYPGYDSTEPWIARPGKGAFVWCRSSNPGAADIQDLPVQTDAGVRPLYEAIAEKAHSWDRHGNVGLVVGATYPAELARIRALCPEMPILVPGVGAQRGALAESVRAGLDARGRGVLINASRGVTYASKGADFADAARREALRLRDEINREREAVAARR
jgi:orotidine-5'-phosphate decarboxylase